MCCSVVGASVTTSAQARDRALRIAAASFFNVLFGSGPASSEFWTFRVYVVVSLRESPVSPPLIREMVLPHARYLLLRHKYRRPFSKALCVRATA